MARPSTPAKATPEVISAVAAVIEPIVAAAGYDLEGITIRPAGGRRLLQLLLDADGGITLDEVAQVSRAVSAALDESAAMGEAPYLLDVGSPGVDRPLTLLRHWRRNTGRLVRLVAHDGSASTGRVLGATGEADDRAPAEVRLDIDGGEVAIDVAGIKRAVVQVEFRAFDGEPEGADGPPERDEPQEQDEPGEAR
jgi:ribosome maturation factor RimP